MVLKLLTNLILKSRVKRYFSDRMIVINIKSFVRHITAK